MAELPLSFNIRNCLAILLVDEFLVLVFLGPLIKVAWDKWPSSEPGPGWSPGVLTAQYQWGSLGIRLFGVDVHASSWLHSGGVWLINLFGELWDSVAVKYFNIEFNIGVEWDWLTTKWGLGESTSISVVGWAVKACLGSLLELSKSEIPASKDFMSSKREGLWKTSWLGSGVCDFSSILEISCPVDLSPITWLAILTFSCFSDTNSNS